MANLFTDLFLITVLIWTVSKLIEIPKEFIRLWKEV